MAAIVGALGLVVLRMLDKLLARTDEARAARAELREEIARLSADRDAEHQMRREAEKAPARRLPGNTPDADLIKAYERERAARLAADREVARLRRALMAAIAESTPQPDGKDEARPPAKTDIRKV